VELCKYNPATGGEFFVAVKRLRPSILSNKEELVNFVEETKLLRKFEHRCQTVPETILFSDDFSSACLVVLRTRAMPLHREALGSCIQHPSSVVGSPVAFMLSVAGT
jgi:hypothetical protein